jgi:outer membrane receptor protein involved in Fe transport
MHTLKPLVRGLLVTGLAAHLGASAQAPAPDRDQRLEKIVVTGSSIKRIATEGALPMITIRRADLERAGINSAEQLILNLNTNGTGLDNLASNADVVDGAARGNNGATSANLRSQGSNATLILLNGRRVAAHGLNGGTVDLNQIPMAAIERIEVLKDGASAIYGTDAVGGVINFIMRNDFRGAELRGSADITEAGGGNIFSGSVAAGFGDIEADGFNVVATLGVRDNKALRGDQRDFVNTFQPDRGLSVDTRGTPLRHHLPVRRLAVSQRSGLPAHSRHQPGAALLGWHQRAGPARAAGLRRRRRSAGLRRQDLGLPAGRAGLRLGYRARRSAAAAREERDPGAARLAEAGRAPAGGRTHGVQHRVGQALLEHPADAGRLAPAAVPAQCRLAGGLRPASSTPC